MNFNDILNKTTTDIREPLPDLLVNVRARSYSCDQLHHHLFPEDHRHISHLKI